MTQVQATAVERVEMLRTLLADASIDEIAAALPALTAETQSWAMGSYTLPANGKRPAVTKAGVYVNLGSAFKEQYLPASRSALLTIARQALHAATVLPEDAATGSTRQRATSADAIAALLASIREQNAKVAPVAPVAPVKEGGI